MVKDNKKYDETSLNDLLTINSMIDVKQLCYKNFHFIKKMEKDQYVVIEFEK